MAWRVNEEADRLVGKVGITGYTTEEFFFSESKVMVSVNQSQINGSVYDRLTEQVHAPVLEKYLCDKFWWSVEQLHSINWEAMGVYTSRLKPVKETNVIKLVMHWQNDNHQNGKFYKDKSNISPALQVEVEDHMHF